MKRDTGHTEQIYICNQCGEIHPETSIGFRLVKDPVDHVLSYKLYCGPVGCGSDDVQFYTEADALDHGRPPTE